MLHFYPGISLKDLDSMEAARYHSLWRAITQIEAQKTLVDLTVAAYTRTKEVKRKKIHRDLHKSAYPYNEEKAVTSEDLARMLGGLNGR